MTPPITDHVFRRLGAYVAGITTGRCTWLGRCNRMPDDHITRPDFQTEAASRRVCRG